MGGASLYTVRNVEQEACGGGGGKGYANRADPDKVTIERRHLKWITSVFPGRTGQHVTHPYI